MLSSLEEYTIDFRTSIKANIRSGGIFTMNTIERSHYQNRALSVPPEYFQVVEQPLQDVNPYIGHLKSAVTTIPREQPLHIEMVNEVAGREVAAIVYFTNVQQMHPGSILIHRSNELGGQKVSILSSYYDFFATCGLFTALGLLALCDLSSACDL